MGPILRVESVVVESAWEMGNVLTPLCITFFDTKNFQKHQSVPQRNFSVLWDEKFLIFFVIPPIWLLKLSRPTDG